MTCTKLKLLIVKSGMRQIAIAQELGISEGQFSKIVSGYAPLTDKIDAKLAEILGVKDEELYESP